MERSGTLDLLPRVRGQNRRGEATRAALVDAGWRLVEGMTISQLFASLTATDVAREAGRTTGAFFHHFETFDEFAAAMVDSFASKVDNTELLAATERVLDLRDGVATMMRQLNGDVWDVTVHAEDQRTELMRFLLLSAVGDRSVRPDGTTQADVVRRVMWEERLDSLEASFLSLWTVLGREPVEPFDHRSAALAVYAMLLGLRMAERVGVTVDREFVGELAPALAMAMSRPKDAVGAREARDADLEPPGVAARGFDLSSSGARRVLEAVRGVVPPDGGELRMETVAAAAGMSVADAVATFGTARRAMALTAVLDVADVRLQAERFVDAEPSRAVADAVVSIVRAARGWGPITSALLAERAAEPAHRHAAPGGDVVDAVPLGQVVLRSLEALRGREDCRSCAEDAELAVDLALQVALSRPRIAPAAVAELVVRALDLTEPCGCR